MRKILLIAALMSFIRINVSAQNSNPWPITGNVGIGTASPLSILHLVGAGSSVDASGQINGDFIIQANTGGRNTTTGAQIEFALPANTNGALIYGQARIITVAGTVNNGDARGKMILGTRRSFNKLGTGVTWYYGDDLVIDAAGYIGLGTLLPKEKLHVVGNARIDGSIVGNTVNGFAGLSFINTGSNAGVFIPAPGTAASTKRITIDQPNQQLLLESGNSDGGGGIKRPVGGSGETNLFALDNNGTNGFLTFTTGIGESMRITRSGNVSIGTTDSKGYKLAVNGSVVATSVTVKLNSAWPDYVFKKEYQLPSLSYIKNYIDQNQHLPEIPSEQEIVKNGLNLGEMNKLLVKKVEELTLYMIEKDKQLKEQQVQINELKEKSIKQQEQEARLKKLEERLEAITKK